MVINSDTQQALAQIFRKTLPKNYFAVKVNGQFATMPSGMTSWLNYSDARRAVTMALANHIFAKGTSDVHYSHHTFDAVSKTWTHAKLPLPNVKTTMITQMLLDSGVIEIVELTPEIKEEFKL